MPGPAVTIPVDNSATTDRFLPAEPGLSFFLDCGSTRIIFDTGYSDIFQKNAGAMGIDILDADYVVLFHGHMDHTGGLVPLMRRHMEAETERLPHRLRTVIAHPACFYPRPAGNRANTHR